MSDHHASLYLASRVMAAALNLVSVMVFTRLAAPALYGSYLVGFAMSFIIFGSALQWLLHAHFGLYERAQAPRQAGAVLVGLGLCAVPVGLGLVWLTAVGWMDGTQALAIGVLVAGLALHTTLVELGRVRLLVREVTAASVLRGVLVLAAGTLALLLVPSAQLLLVAVGLAQAAAALPVLPALLQHGVARPQRRDLVALWRYGWPLLPALAAGAVAINLDRVVVEAVVGPAAAGAYGALSDLIRQGFVVMGEAIAAAYLSQAKSAGALRPTILSRAFVTLWAIVVLGVVGWLLLGAELAGAVLGPGFGVGADVVLPLLVVATALLTLRAYYFGQAIYFAGSARREVVANGVMLLLAGTALLLVPGFGATGAAAAMALTQAGGLAGFLWQDRRTRLMPVDLPVARTMLAIGLLTLAVGWVAVQLSWWLGLLVVLSAAAAMAWQWDLLGARSLLVQGRAAASRTS